MPHIVGRVDICPLGNQLFSGFKLAALDSEGEGSVPSLHGGYLILSFKMLCWQDSSDLAEVTFFGSDHEVSVPSR